MSSIPDREHERLAELDSYQILDTPPDMDFDRLTKLAAIICEVPIALISLADGRRQWFKSSVGIDITEMPRCDAFCTHVIQGKDLFIIPDTSADPVFAHNPLVTSNFGLRFYAGVPLVSPRGFAVGTLCVMDKKPRLLTSIQSEALQMVAEEVMIHMELNRQRLIAKFTERRIKDQASLLDAAHDAIIVRDLENVVQYWNEGARKLYGWTAEEMLGQHISILLPNADFIYGPVITTLLRDGEWAGELHMVNKNGKSVTVESHCTLVLDQDKNPISIFSIENDITQRKVSEEKIHKLAFFDSLTNLPNRELLMDRLHKALANANRLTFHGALLFIDLDHFKTLNDTLGHDMGDLLLQQVAERLTNCVREADTVARLGGDEFIVILENLSPDPRQALAQVDAVGNKILENLNIPYQLAGHAHQSSPSIGVTIFDSHKETVEELLKQADIAMYEAKALGRNLMCFYDPEMQKVISHNARMESDIRNGLRANQFNFYFQPQLRSQGAVSAEALARWNHPQYGVVYPIDFIPLAESSGLIITLGKHLLEIACRQLAAWAKKSETRNIVLAVNISNKQIRQDDFVAQVLFVLQRHGADPHKLRLEITESVLVENLESTIAKLNELKAIGVSLSLDDFGTGYSSLAYLKRLPLDELKIDQTFIHEVAVDEDDAAITRTILALGLNLGLEVIAEGVETDDQRNFLEENNCYQYQGYLYSKPLPIEQFEAFVARTY